MLLMQSLLSHHCAPYLHPSITSHKLTIESKTHPFSLLPRPPPATKLEFPVPFHMLKCPEQDKLSLAELQALTG